MDDCTWRMQMVWRMKGGWEAGAALNWGSS
jgi:hypothetical protein